MVYDETILLWMTIWATSWFIAWFIVWFITCKKTTIKRQEIFWSIFFVIWICMHIYWFIYELSVPFVFDIVWAWSAGMVLWLEVSEQFTKALLSKIWKWK